MNGWAKTKQTGFTIVELLIVIVVIGILAAITIVAYTGVQGSARDAERKSDIAAAQKALEMYYTEKGTYPKQGNVATDSMQNMDFVTGDEMGMSRSQAEAPGRRSRVTLSSGVVYDPNNLAFTQDCYGANMDVSYSGDCKGMYGYRSILAGGTSSCWNINHTCGGYKLWYALDKKTSSGQSAVLVVGGEATCETHAKIKCIRSN